MFLDWMRKLDDRETPFALHVHCNGCGHSRNVDHRVYQNIFGKSATFQAISPKLRCSKCGARGPDMRPVNLR